MNLMMAIDKEFLGGLKVNDHIYYAEYENSKKGVRVKKLKVKFIHGGNSTIESVKTDAFLCDLIDTEFPKVTIRKADISRGYYATPRAALEAFTSIIETIYTACKDALAELA